MKNPIQKLRKFALALVVLGSLATAHIAAAAKIELDVYLPKYGYVVVRPDSNTGGAIRWDAAHYCYYTDRVNRGERLYIYATPTKNESTSYAEFVVWCDSQHSILVDRLAPWYSWCWYEEYVVPADPNKDNVYIYFLTNLTGPPVRIPIGLRNP